jgi:hypothetical protein
MSDVRLLDQIRGRVDAQHNRYGARWNQILRDRSNLLTMVDNRDYVIEHMLRCKDAPLCKSCREMGREALTGKIL